MWTMVWWYRLRVTPNSSTRALWQPPALSGDPVSRDISEASRRMDEGNDNLVYPSPWNFKISLTCHKILRHGTSGFTSHPKEGVLLILSPLKIHRLGRIRTHDLESSGKHTSHYTTEATANTRTWKTSSVDNVTRWLDEQSRMTQCHGYQSLTSIYWRDLECEHLHPGLHTYR
jgi:hypothetical protein